MFIIPGLFLVKELNGQCVPCNSNVPSFYIDLTASPNAVDSIISVRNGSCCGVGNPDRCIRFFVSVHPSTTDVSFTVANPAPPGGAGYMVDCGPLISLANPFCLTNGDTSFCIVFCKSGNDAATYIFTAYDLSYGASDDITLTAGCTGEMSVVNLQEPTITWNSIYPGVPGTYNSWLSCTSECDTTFVTPPLSPVILPPYIDYVVTGNGYGCFFGIQQDTVRVYLIPQVTVNLTAPPYNVCYDPPQLITANAANGIPPYNYLWSTGQTSQSITVSAGGTYTVTVVDSAGCSEVTASVTYDEPPPMNMVAGANNNIICDGQQLQLNLQTINGATYNWSGPNGFISNLQNPVINNFSAVNSGIYAVFASIGNCISDTAFINVAHQPQAFITVGNQNICFGDSVTLTANCHMTGGSFLWTPGDITGNQIIISPDLTTTYSVYHEMNGCTSNVATSTVTVTEINLNVNDATICYGSNATLNVSGAATYQWSSGHQANSITVSPVDTTIYSVTGFLNGCSSSADAAVFVIPQTILSASSQPALCFNSCNGTAVVSVTGNTGPYQYLWNTTPAQSVSGINNLCPGTYTVLVTDAYNCLNTASVTITQPDSLIILPFTNPQICIGETATLTAMASGGNGNYNYAWSTGNSGNSITVSPAVTSNYSLTVSDQNGCESSATIFTVNVLDSLNLITSGEQYICVGESIGLSAIASGGNGIYYFTWTPANTNQNQITVSPAATTNYTVTLTDGCTTPAVSANVIVNVMPLPAPDFIANINEACVPACIDFIDKSVISCPVSSYTWNTSNTSITSHSSTFKYCYDYPGLYDVRLTIIDSAGCENSILKPAFVKMNPSPVADFYTIPSGPTTNPEIMFVNTSYGASMFHWNFGDGVEETNSYLNTYHLYSDSGEYCIELTAINEFECTDKTVECVKILQSLQVYIPNAFTPDGHNNIFNFKGLGINPDDFVLNIFNRWGEMVFQTFDPERGWNGRQKDGTKAPTDVYIYKFIMKDMLGKTNEFSGFVTLLY